MRLSKKLKASEWSMNGLDFGWKFGVEKMFVATSRNRSSIGSPSNAPSNDSTGRDPFRQFPVSFSSSKVVTKSH